MNVAKRKLTHYSEIVLTYIKEMYATHMMTLTFVFFPEYEAKSV